MARSEGLRQFLHALLGLPALLLAAGIIPSGPILFLILSALLLHGYGATTRILPGLVRAAERRPEQRWNDGPSHYAYGVAIALLCFPAPFAALGWLGLALGDSLSNAIGRTCPIRSITPGRSLGGAIGMSIGITLSVICVHTLVPFPHPILTALAASIAGILAEIVTNRRLNDNLILPSVIAVTAWALTNVAS